jgi:hypothetical protein
VTYVPLSHPVRLRRVGKEVRIVIDGSDPFAPLPIPDPSLIKAIAKAHRFNDRLLHGGIGRVADLQKARICTDPTTAKSFGWPTSPPTPPPTSLRGTSLLV